jgi:hypothetical protein
MNISSLYGSLASTATSNVAATSATQAVSPGGSIPAAPPGAGSASISTPGQFFSEMQQLSESNPSEFKAVATQVAASFQSAASQATGQQAQFLTSLAATFTQAAQTGSLQAPQGAGSGQAAPSTGTAGAHHHHHHHGGGSSSSGSSSIQQAFESAMSILTQATQGGSAATTSKST